MKNSLNYLPLMLASFFILSCQNLRTPANAVRCVDTNFKDEIESNQNLSFTFNKDLLSSDSLLNIWLDENPVSLTPSVMGKCKWVSRRELIFSPMEEFPMATDFKISLSDKITQFAPKSLSLIGEVEYKVHTAYLNLVGSSTRWIADPDDPTKIQLRTDIKFNMQVNPQKAQEMLEATINGKKAEFKILNTKPAKKLSLVFAEPPSTNEKAVVKVIVKKFSKTMQQDEFATKSSVVSTNELKLTGIETAHSGLEGSVFIHTSQPVKESSLQKAIRIVPKINFNVSSDNDGITISSEEFNPEETYTVRVSEEMIGIFGGKMNDEYDEEISFGDLSPQVHFENTKAEFLGSKGSRNVAITITKVDKVKVTVYKVFQNNIMAFMRQDKDWNYDHEYDEESDHYIYHDYENYMTNDVAEKIWEKEYKVDNLKDYGYSKLLKLDIQDKYKDFKGIYVVQVEDEDRAWNQDSKIITVSDIGLIVKQDKDQVHIFANSILNTEPLKDVEMTVISTTNQELGKTKTDKEGYAVFDIPANLKSFRVGMVAAVSKDSDFNYVLFNKTEVNTSRFDVGGKYLLAYGYDAYIYGERDIYRPGEAVHLNTVIRTNEWGLPGEMPVKAKLILPNGKEFQTVKNYLDKQGAFETTFDIPQAAVTGIYSFQVFSGDDELLGTKNIMIEEFMPDRIKVDLKTDTTAYYPNKKVNASFTATNYFGPPAANRNYEVTFTINKKYDIFPEFGDYTFSGSKYANFSTVTRNGITDANGTGTESVDVPAEYSETGILDGTVFTTVFDETGRPVNRSKHVDIFTQDVFFGIRFVDDFFSTRQGIKIPVIALNKKGQPLNGQKASLKIIRKRWETILKRVDGQLRYESQEIQDVVDNKIITINGRNSVYTYYAKESGNYEARLSAINSENYVSFNFYAYGWSDTYNSSFEVNTEGKIDIETDKKNYKIGDDAKVLLKLPFDGKVLVTVERDKVFDHFYITSKNKAASFKLELEDKHVPNVYVSATLIKPNTEDGMPLTVAYGYEPVLVENPDNKINMTITAVDQTRSKMKQTIKFNTKSNTEMTVAVVDEGILALKDQKSANPYDYFYEKRALDVDMYNIYPYLFPEITALGGGFDDISKRVNPLTNKRVKLVSFWSGIIKTDMFGNASFTVNIPQFSGKLRIMAVAYNGKCFGAGEKNMTVSDPVVISSGIPRFVAPADLLTIPVTVSNTTKKPVSGTVSIQTEGVLQTINTNTSTVTIPANTEQQVDFTVQAKNETGLGKIKVNVKALNENFSEETDITCRPNASFTKYSGTGTVNAGSSIKLDFNKVATLASSSQNVVISNSPLIQFSKNLNYLLNYPYGCVEQTVSSVFPQLYFSDMAKLLNNKTAGAGQASSNIQAAIAKLQGMQLSNGALSYWPDYGSESWWGTAYALHFLVEAEKAGYIVPSGMKKKIENYLSNRLKTKSTEWLYTSSGQKKEVITEETAYSLYVLALDGEGKLSSLNYYKSNPGMLTTSSKYLIACSYALMGEKKKYNEMLPAAYEEDHFAPMFNGSFYSDLRNMALTLNTLLETDPKNPQINYLAKHVADALRTYRYLNTQESVFGYLAMGKIAKKAAKSNPTATVISNGKVIGNYAGKDLAVSGKQISNNQVTISAKGSGSIYYFWAMDGIPMDGKLKEEDNFLQVRKRYLNRYGVEYRGLIDQNDMVVVEISIRSTAGMSVPNVAITDLLPAGFEIENTRLTDFPQLDWIKDASQPEYKDVRDDRMNLIVTANTFTNKYYYVCRAVSLGTFNAGPVCADAMYRGEYHSYNGARQITVARKKPA